MDYIRRHKLYKLGIIQVDEKETRLFKYFDSVILRIKRFDDQTRNSVFFMSDEGKWLMTYEKWRNSLFVSQRYWNDIENIFVYHTYITKDKTKKVFGDYVLRVHGLKADSVNYSPSNQDNIEKEFAEYIKKK